MQLPSQFRNAILANLREEERCRLALSPSVLEAGQSLISPGERGYEVLFLEAGLASTTVAFADGRQVETNLLGPEAAIGLLRVLSMEEPRYCTHTEVRGKVYAAPAALVRRICPAWSTA